MYKSYAVYYLDDSECERPINIFDSTRISIKDGCYIFYELRSDEPNAAYPVNAFYVLEVAE